MSHGRAASGRPGDPVASCSCACLVPARDHGSPDDVPPHDRRAPPGPRGTAALFRRVEVVGDPEARGRPVLLVANHFYGFVDPVVLMQVFGRLPRFLAKSTLWDVVPARPLLALAGMIPVHRPEDRGAGGHDNADVFAACHEVLAADGFVGIFPEGTTHDDPAIREVRTGAARIALGAHAAGVRDLVILPVGVHYDDKVALRSNAWPASLPMYDIAAEVSAAGHRMDSEDRDAVTQVTEVIDRGHGPAGPRRLARAHRRGDRCVHGGCVHEGC